VSTKSRVGFLRHGCNAFKDTLLPNESAGTIQNTLRPGEFITIVEAEHSGLRIRWFQPLGGVFVGVGLLVTKMLPLWLR
jgi:hypothetical protein